ncbi:MAG: DUF2341 domain-containing protein, partial [Candidatus Moranbacteria bacterium]|nr:DUF2341 domain-containing protein [Candidatus Moranbacteria bacterium]
MDIKRKESKLVISNQSSVIKTPKKKRLVLGFKKHSSYKTYLSNMTNFLFKTKKRKLIFSLALILLIIAPLSFYLWNKQAGASWWNSDWNYRRSITINSAQIPGDLNNFPMLVSFTDSNLINKTQSNGNDIIFIEENGTRLNHEIEKFDNTTGELVVWVKIPELDGDNDSIIYMYYGNQTVDNQQRPEDVWDEN